MRDDCLAMPLSATPGRGAARALDDWLDRRWPPRCRVDSTKGLYLTFDDGPVEPFTAQIATLLEQRGHRGSFFMTGSGALRHPWLVRALYASGHAVGSHSFAHLRGWLTSAVPLCWDYVRGHRAVAAALGERVTLFRPPYGYVNTCTRAFTRASGCELVLWSCDSDDWRPGATADAIVRRVEPALEPGAIILMHDWIVDNCAARDRVATVTAVARILDLIEARGLVGRALA